MTTGMSRVVPAPLMARRVSTPSTPGIIQSRRTRSGRWARACAMQVAPSVASRTSNPSPESTVLQRSRTAASSSATRILGILEGLLDRVDQVHGLERLGEVTVHAQLHSPLDVGALREGGEHHYRDGG